MVNVEMYTLSSVCCFEQARAGSIWLLRNARMSGLIKQDFRKLANRRRTHAHLA